jgi:hypothetical protein
MLHWLQSSLLEMQAYDSCHALMREEVSSVCVDQAKLAKHVTIMYYNDHVALTMCALFNDDSLVSPDGSGYQILPPAPAPHQTVRHAQVAGSVQNGSCVQDRLQLERAFSCTGQCGFAAGCNLSLSTMW